MLLTAGGQLWAVPLLRLLNTPEDVLGGSVLYLRIVYGGIPAIMAYNLLASILRALGDAKTPLYAIVVAALMNVVLDLLFVMGFGWGIAGAAIATVISQVASAVYCYLNVRKITFLQVRKEDLRPGRALSLQLLKLGFPNRSAERHYRCGQHGGAVCHQRVRDAVPGGLYRHQQALRHPGDRRPPPTASPSPLTWGRTWGPGWWGASRRGCARRWLSPSSPRWSSPSPCCSSAGWFWACSSPGTRGRWRPSLNIAFHYLSIMAVCLPILYLLYIYRSGLMGLGDTVVPMVSGIAEMIVRMGVVLLLPLVMGQEGVYYAEVGAWTAAALILAGAYYLRIRALSRRKGFALDEKGGDLR